MPPSNRVKSHYLEPGNKYFVQVNWNLDNDLRLDKGFTFIGTFISLKYIKGKINKYFDGLVSTLRSPSKIHVLFRVNNHNIYVSSMNEFYARIGPNIQDIMYSCTIRKLPLPIEIKRTYIYSYLNISYIRKLRKKRRHNKSLIKHIPLTPVGVTS